MHLPKIQRQIITALLETNCHLARKKRFLFWSVTSRFDIEKGIELMQFICSGNHIPTCCLAHGKHKFYMDFSYSQMYRFLELHMGGIHFIETRTFKYVEGIERLKSKIFSFLLAALLNRAILPALWKAISKYG